VAAWTEDEDAVLIDLHKKGYSASKIAERFVGKSRNAVIGRIHRLGLVKRGDAGARSSAHMEARIRAGKAAPRGRPPTIAKAPAAPKPKAKLPEAEPYIEAKTDETPKRTFATLERGECRWPIGDPKTEGFGFCGCKALPLQVYCETHHKRAFQPGSTAKRKPDESTVPAESVREREGVS
jgi:GcrA cell cycle regulator